MTKTIAVLLTVHNRREKTLNCLQNLFSQKMPEGYEIKVYLTDDGCTDGTLEAVSKVFPQVHIIKGDGNLFWNRGMWTAWNAAVRDNRYNFYLWLNDDTYTYPEMLESLINVSESKGNRAIIVGSTVDTQKRNTHTYGGRKIKSLFH